jgi:hypothetical protein
MRQAITNEIEHSDALQEKIGDTMPHRVPNFLKREPSL